MNPLSLLTGALGGVWGYVVVAVVSASLATAGTAWTTHKIELAKYEALQLRDARAATQIAQDTAAAITQAKDKEIAEVSLARDQAVAEAAAQPKIITQVKRVHDEIPVFITPAVNARTCLPVGLIQLLNNAISAGSQGDTGADTPAATTSQSSDACSPIGVSDFSDQLIDKVILPSEQNAEQLNALEASIKALVASANLDSAQSGSGALRASPAE